MNAEQDILQIMHQFFKYYHFYVSFSLREASRMHISSSEIGGIRSHKRVRINCRR